jgi:inner membrane protein
MFEPLQSPEPGRFRTVLKLVTLGILVLLLLVPVTKVLGLVHERQARLWQVQSELAKTWGAEQTLGALVLAVPYFAATSSTTGVVAKSHAPAGGALAAAPAGWAYFLPGAVQWRGRLEPEVRRRGIFAVTVYESRLTASGWFARPDAAALGIKPEQVDLGRAQVLLLVSDPRGLQERVVLRWGNRDRPFAPGLSPLGSSAGGGTASIELAERTRDGGGPLNSLQAALQPGDLTAERLPFSLALSLRGSEALHLLPLGDETMAEIASPWPHPGFVGTPLPRHRQVAGQGFDASWSVPYFGRGLPQRWRGDQIGPERLAGLLAEAQLGVSLVRPADPYQQTERAVKYAVLFILLTFTTVFVLELLSPVRLHPMQYLLVGAALCLFYLLLLALGEHLGLGSAYAVATAATVVLVTLYTRAVLAGWARALAVGGVLSSLYGWLYTVLRLEDLALLTGALGLFAVLALLMFLTRRLDWATLRFRQPSLG